MDTFETKKSNKNLWIIVATVAVLLAFGLTYAFLSRAVPERGERTAVQTPTQQASDAKAKAIKAETNGDSEDALKQYQTAYNEYKQAKDKDAAEDMSYKIEFMKQAIKQEKATTKKAIKSGESGAVLNKDEQ